MQLAAGTSSKEPRIASILDTAHFSQEDLAMGAQQLEFMLGEHDVDDSGSAPWTEVTRRQKALPAASSSDPHGSAESAAVPPPPTPAEGEQRVVRNKHNVFTHFPKDPNCPVCIDNKSQRAQCRRECNKGEDHEPTIPVSKKFGDLVTMDHKVIGGI